MKKIFVALFTLSMVLFSCQESEVENFSDEDIVDLVEADMASMDQAIAQTGSIAKETESVSLCAYGNDSTISYTSPSGDFSATTSWEWELVCTGQLPTGISLEFDIESELSKTRIAADNKLAGKFLLDNLLSQSNYLLGGDLSSVSKLTTTGRGSTKNYDASTSYAIKNLEFDRVSYKIQSGSMSIKTSGTGQNGGSFSRGATLVFNGNQSATLTLDNGNTYPINW